MLAGRPYRQNRTLFSFYRSADKRTYPGDFQWSEWSDWGFNLRQELGGLVENQGLSAGLTYRNGSFATSETTTVAGLKDTLSEESRTSEFTLRLKDTTEVLGLFDFTAVLGLSKFSSADGLQLLPASGIYYRKLPNTSLYLLAEKTFRPPTAQEGSRRRLPLATVFYTFLSADSQATTYHAPLPEKGTALCLGGAYAQGRALEAQGGFFYRELADAIYWDWPDSLPPGSILKVFLNNRTEIYRGLFALAKFRAFRECINGGLSYTRLLNNDVPSAGMVPALPDDHLAGYLQGKIVIKPDQLMELGLLVAAEYTGEQKRRSWNNTPGPLPAQTVLDATLFYNYLYIKTYLSFKNLLNREPETTEQQTMRTFFGYPARPLNYQFGISLELGGIYDRDREE
jgi:outer membrane receptor protein involved in Fe transport